MGNGDRDYSRETNNKTNTIELVCVKLSHFLSKNQKQN